MDDGSNDKESLDQLADMLDKIESGGLRRLSEDDLLTFGRLYRSAASALAAARSHGVQDAEIQRLNQLVARAYGHVYVAESKGWPSIRTFFAKEFPQSFRRNLLFIAVAFGVFTIAALFAFGVTRNDPGLADVVLGPGTTTMMDSIAERHQGKQDWLPEEFRPIMSSGIMTNNISVAFFAFSGGILAGLGTLFILLYNGLFMGVVAAAVAAHGRDVAVGFWGFVAPHGVTELTAIFTAAGAGLMLGWVFVNPGDYTRGAALKLAARDAIQLVIGVVAMLVVAGVIEAFFSPTLIPEAVKFAFAGAETFILFSYLFVAGRQNERVRESATRTGGNGQT